MDDGTDQLFSAIGDQVVVEKRTEALLRTSPTLMTPCVQRDAHQTEALNERKKDGVKDRKYRP